MEVSGTRIDVPILQMWKLRLREECGLPRVLVSQLAELISGHLDGGCNGV
jgi:hypothetical protein